MNSIKNLLPHFDAGDFLYPYRPVSATSFYLLRWYLGYRCVTNYLSILNVPPFIDNIIKIL